QRRFAGVADPGSTGPPHGYIACFCKFEQAPVFCIPRQRKSAPCEGNLRPETCRSGRQMRRMRLGFQPRCDGIKRAEYLGVNMIDRHTPRRQAGGKLAHKCRRAAQIESAVMRNPDPVEWRNSEVPGGVEIHALLVGWSWPAVLDVAVAVLQFLQQ